MTKPASKPPAKGKTKAKAKSKAAKVKTSPQAEPAPAPKDFIGRPLTYTREKADAVLALMVEGPEPLSMRGACEKLALSSGTFCGWVVEDIDGISERYARAQQIRAQILADEIVDISDDGSRDYKEVETEGRIRLVPDQDHIQRSKLRIDSRKWILAKALPKIYGDKLQLAGDGGGPIKTQAVAPDLAGMSVEQLEAVEAVAAALAGSGQLARKP